MTDLSGIRHFKDRIVPYAKKVENLAMKIAEKGVEIAQGYYAGSSVSVYAESTGIGTARVVAEGDKVFFEEYGTGWVGEREKYPGELPTNTFIFESAGKMRSTSGWEYHYPNENTKKPKINPYFWYTPTGERSSGEAPMAQMWKTSRELREQLPQISKAELNAER